MTGLSIIVGTPVLMNCIAIKQYMRYMGKEINFFKSYQNIHKHVLTLFYHDGTTNSQIFTVIFHIQIIFSQNYGVFFGGRGIYDFKI
jgi:hypothetical protein